MPPEYGGCTGGGLTGRTRIVTRMPVMSSPSLALHDICPRPLLDVYLLWNERGSEYTAVVEVTALPPETSAGHGSVVDVSKSKHW